MASLARKIGIRKHERTSLLLAATIHVLLASLLVASPPRDRVVLPPERISVTLANDLALQETAPSTSPAEVAPPTEPNTASTPPASEPAQPPNTAVEEPAKPLPPPVSPAMAKPKPLPIPSATPKPAPRPVAVTSPAPKASPITKSAPSPKPSTPSRIGSDFLKGVPKPPASSQASTGSAGAQSAATIGPAVQSALTSAISRKLKPKWVAPQGAEAEKLVTVLAWNLNRDGTLAGPPRLVRQEGITAANRPQAQRHYEQAVRAVQLAAPFTLPAEYYEAWKRVKDFRFDRRLSQ